MMQLSCTKTFTAQEVMETYSRAANDTDGIEIPESENDYRGTLLVTVGIFYLTGEATTVEEALRLGWKNARVEDGRLHVTHKKWS